MSQFAPETACENGGMAAKPETRTPLPR